MQDNALKQIGLFLRHKRESIIPELVGIIKTSRSRTPGLRREDVAYLSGMSSVWYSKIERGKAEGISRTTLLSLSEVLRLDETERQYLMNLAGLEAATIRNPCMHVSNETLRLIELINPLPAILINDYFDIIATNHAYEVMCGIKVADLPENERNYLGLMLSNSVWQKFLQLDDEVILEKRVARLVGTLRGIVATRPNDSVLFARIEKFCQLSPIFIRQWESKTVSRPEEMLFSFNHAILGSVILKKQIWLNLNGERTGRLDVYHPQNENDFNRFANC